MLLHKVILAIPYSTAAFCTVLGAVRATQIKSVPGR